MVKIFTFKEWAEDRKAKNLRCGYTGVLCEPRLNEECISHYEEYVSEKFNDAYKPRIRKVKCGGGL